MKTFAMIEAMPGLDTPTLSHSHATGHRAIREVWTPKGRLILWDSERPASTNSHEAMMELYQQFGEECAERNILPNYTLFTSWLSSKQECEPAL